MESTNKVNTYNADVNCISKIPSSKHPIVNNKTTSRYPAYITIAVDLCLSNKLVTTTICSS